MFAILAAVLTLASPAGPGSAEPHLTTTKSGTLLMSWIEGKSLKFAEYERGRWSSPRTIATRDDFFINWADFPSIVEDAKGTLFVHWLQKSGPGTYAYDVRVSSSLDGGRSWAPARVLHTDRKQAEHGFVSMVPLAGGGVAAVWLDGREMFGEHGPMTLRYAEIDSALRVTNEKVLDNRVCECCGTSMAMTTRGPLVAYRDRSQSEVRDIGVVHAKGPATPKLLHGDGWRINGCPVNGPQLDASGSRVVAAWFTSPNNQPRVHAAFSKDGGANFGTPLRIDGGLTAVGRVDVLMLDDGSAVVVWVEGASEAAGIMLRRVYPDGRRDAPVRLAATSAARAAGFPRAARIGKTAYFAWTDPGTKRVRVASYDVR